MKIMGNIRATRRVLMGIAAAPVIAVLAALQGFVVGPLTKNYEVIPGIFYATLRKVFGYKIEFNAASAPIVKNKPVWFLSNHMAVADFVIAGSALKGSFVGKDDILKWPGIAQIARAGKFIGVRRKSEYNDEARGKIAKNFNSGFNTIMFPEGTTSDGKKVYLFRAALLTLLYGDKSIDRKKRDVPLKKEVVVQPVAIRVKSVNGKPAAANDDIRNQYSRHSEHNALKRTWHRLQIKETRIELTIFPALNPKDFADAKELSNKAALDVASVVNPGQTTFEKAVIPGSVTAKVTTAAATVVSKISPLTVVSKMSNRG